MRLVIDQPSLPYCVATALNPQLRLLWFQSQWSAFPLWYKKAERSIQDVFQRYIDAKEEDAIEPNVSVLRRRKTPGGKYHDKEFEETSTEAGVVLRVLRYRIGIFKGQKAMMAGVYGYPKGGENLPGLVQIHGGGQYADTPVIDFFAQIEEQQDR